MRRHATLTTVVPEGGSRDRFDPSARRLLWASLAKEISSKTKGELGGVSFGLPSPEGDGSWWLGPMPEALMGADDPGWAKKSRKIGLPNRSIPAISVSASSQ